MRCLLMHRRWVTHPGMKVTVIGIGGLGHLAIQFAAKMGCEVSSTACVSLEAWATRSPSLLPK